MHTSTPVCLLIALGTMGALAAQQPTPVPVYHGSAQIRPVPPAGPDLPGPPKHVIPDLPSHKQPPLPHVAPGGGEPQVPPAQVLGQTLAASANDQVRFTDVAVTPAAGAATSRIGEPAATMADANNGWYTGNWHAARTTNGGASWTQTNPFTRFGAGFCCDQRVISHNGVTVWVLQYGTNFTRFAVARNPALVGTDAWEYAFDLNAPSYGLPATDGVDFPDVAYNAANLYFSTGIVRGGGVVQSAIVWISWASLIAGAPGYGFVLSSTLGGGIIWRLTQTAGIGTTMYAASHVNNTVINVCTLAPSGVTTLTRTINAWSGTSYVDLCPDNNDWLSRYDSRILGAYATSTEVGFLWCSAAIAPYPRPHTRILRLKRSDLSILDQHVIWFPDTSVAYPSAAPNAAGQIGINVAVGGGTRYPSSGALIVDDINPWGNFFVDIYRAGTSSPVGGNAWGDYFTTTVLNADDKMIWVGTGNTLQGGRNDANAEHRFVTFGRDAFDPNSVGMIVRSNPPGATVFVNAVDVHGQSSGTAPFYRKYANNAAGITLTAQQSFVSGSQRYIFRRWRGKGVPDESLAFTDYALEQRLIGTLGNTLGTTSDVYEAVYVPDASPGVTANGAGCGASPFGVPVHTLSPTAPRQATPMTYGLSGARPAVACWLQLGFASSAPIDLTALGLGGCVLRQSLDVAVGTSTGSGATSIPITFPVSSTLIGARLYSIYIVADSQANLLGLAVSNGLNALYGGAL